MSTSFLLYSSQAPLVMASLPDEECRRTPITQPLHATVNFKALLTQRCRPSTSNMPPTIPFILLRTVGETRPPPHSYL